MQLFTMKQRFVIWSSTFGTIGVFGLIGWGLDKLFDTRPIIFVLGVLLSFPFSLFIAIRRLQPVIEADVKRIEKELQE
jgi:F0F1-type ATP synthase assembly protein I